MQVASRIDESDAIRPDDNTNITTPLVRGFWFYSSAYPSEGAILRHEQCEQRRKERQMRHAMREQQELQDNKTRIMLASAFICAGISIGVMTRLGDTLLSSVVYGAMIGAFVDLLGAIAVAIFGASDSPDWNDCLAEAAHNDRHNDGTEPDFAGLGLAMFSPLMANDQKDVLVDASFVPVAVANDHKALNSSSQEDDMIAFIDALANDSEEYQDDIII